MTTDPFGLFGMNQPETPLQRAARESLANSRKPAAPAPKGLPQIRGKEIAGVLYVRAEDVADALDVQAPTACARLIRKLRGAR